MTEIWKDIEEYKGDYQISNHGRVKSLKKYNGTNERILKPGGVHGYLHVVLTKNKIGKQFYIHRLVGLAFIPNPENKKQINHIDGNKKNNNVNNLEWVSSKENTEHAIKTCLRDNKGENHTNSKLRENQVLEIRKLYNTGKYTQLELAELYGVYQCLICNIINRKNWKHI